MILIFIHFIWLTSELIHIDCDVNIGCDEFGCIDKIKETKNPFYV